MPISFTDFVEGDVMSPAALAANWALARTWLEAVPASDVAAAAIQREHLVRPVIGGYPLEGGASTVQGAYGYSRGLGQPAALARTEWGPRRTRITWLSEITDGKTDAQTWRTPVGRGGIYLPRSADVKLVMSADLQVRGATTVLYPNGAGGAGTASAGYLAFHSWSRSTRTDTVHLSSHRDLYPIEASSLHSDKVLMILRDRFSAGVYDFGLVWHRINAPDGLQFDLDRVTLALEVK